MNEDFDRIQDISHISHVELLTPKPEESLAFFRDILGLNVIYQQGQSAFLRAWGEHQLYSLKLTEAPYAGLGHVGLRTMSPRALERRIHAIEQFGQGIGWIEGDYGHGKAYRFLDPDGHILEVFYEADRYKSADDLKPYLKNQPDRFVARGVSVSQLDHINLFSSNVDADSAFLQKALGFRLSEQAITDEGKQTTAWLHVTNKSYDLAISLDHSGAKGRFHHIAFKVDSTEMVLRAADVFMDHHVFIEAAPSKHVAGQTTFVYAYEPGGNRVEVCAGGFLIFTPDWETVTWTPEERRRGLAWGSPLPSTFHTYGTPVVTTSKE
ncbi:MAG: VOC family protein [Alicyclobacillus macrosporangiidus]|uniref:VOC family protein n=1 Tax=Alicyclobacillus macrosporangiidus TaxID=392015 RepID=UPI0026F2C997|nr:VOC family protein [Alicyclobacillus macrosporangiidus]MCL6600475.1 VOC family protein [Alicyclobacillus macrosporangiidus]